MRRRRGGGEREKGRGAGTGRSARAFAGEGEVGGGGGRVRARRRRPWRGFRRWWWAFCSEDGGVAVDDLPLWKETEEEEVIVCAGLGHQINPDLVAWCSTGRVACLPPKRKWIQLGHCQNVVLWVSLTLIFFHNLRFPKKYSLFCCIYSMPIEQFVSR